MRDCIDETVVLFIAANFSNQKNRIQRQPGNDQNEKDDAENQQRDLSPVKHNPADVQGYCQNDQADSEDGKKDNGFFSMTHQSH